MRKMKDSGVEWIGEIPEDWQITKIGNLYDIVLGKMLSPKPVYDTDTLENYICATNIKWHGVNTDTRKQMWFSEEEKKMYLLLNGDVLVMEGGMAGTSCIYKGEMEPCYMQNSALRCRSKLSGDNRFVYYWMHAVYNTGYIDSICNKATIQHYTKDKISHTPMTVMPLKEQIRMVDYLDTKCAKIDAIIAKQEAIIEKLKEYKLSIITDSVTKGLNPDVEMKDSGVKWLGKYPKHWEYLSFKHVLRERSEKNNPIKSSERLSLSIDKGVTLYSEKTTNLDRFKDDVSLYKLAHEGDLVLNSMNMIVGAIGVSDYFGCVSPAYYTYYDCETDHITARFCDYLLRCKTMRKVLFGLGKGIMAIDRGDDRINTCRLKVSRDDLRSLKIPVPPVSEQRNIVHYLNEKTSKIDKTIEDRIIAIKKLQDYKKSLIYEVVTGKKEV